MVPTARTAPLGWKPTDLPWSWSTKGGRTRSVQIKANVKSHYCSVRPGVCAWGTVTSMVLLQRGWWELVSQRWTCLSWEQVTNCSMEGWTSRPQSSSVWPWNPGSESKSGRCACKLKPLRQIICRSCVSVFSTCTIGVNVSGNAARMMAFLVVPTKSSPGFPSARARTGPNDSPTWMRKAHTERQLTCSRKVHSRQIQEQKNRSTKSFRLTILTKDKGGI